MSRRRKQSVENVRVQKSELSTEGKEIPDPVPMQAPLGLRRQPTLAERIRDAVRSENWARERERAGEETFEEADDFDVGDDYDPSSPYEEMFEGEFDHHREERRMAQMEETQKNNRARRGTRRRQSEPVRQEGTERTPEPTPTPAPAGSARRGANPGETPTSS